MPGSAAAILAARWRVRAVAGVIAAGLLLTRAAVAHAQPAPETDLYRIFLKAGPAVVSWGDFARIGDRVAFSLPIGDPAKPTTLQLVSLAADVIDWDRTNEYADSVRYRRYAATHGEADYKALTAEMARTLQAIAFSTDAVARLAAAEEARRRLAEWPAQHFGYRATDVRELAAAVEETIAGLRADAGERHFEINLVATLEPPSTPMLPAPTLQESIELARTVARTTDVPEARRSLQAAISEALGGNRRPGSPAWAASALRRVKADVRAAERVDRRYANLAVRATRDAMSRARAADVTGVEAILAGVRRADARSRFARPEEIRNLTAVLGEQLDVARQRRLDLDRWRLRETTYRGYRRSIAARLAALDELVKAADQVRAMSGPPLRDLVRAERGVSDAALALRPLTPPDDLRASHDALVSAVGLLQAAFGGRRVAIVSADLSAARNASAAAAGALLLVEQARAEIRRYFSPPDLR